MNAAAKTAAKEDNFTAPEAVKSVQERAKALTLALESGVATQYWLGLLAYPPGSARSLWLFVGKAWRRLDNPNEGTQLSVQDAFANASNRLEVAVWYTGEVIVGLVVRTK
jgi:hypothetical protein